MWTFYGGLMAYEGETFIASFSLGEDLNEYESYYPKFVLVDNGEIVYSLCGEEISQGLDVGVFFITLEDSSILATSPEFEFGWFLEAGDDKPYAQVIGGIGYFDKDTYLDQVVC